MYPVNLMMKMCQVVIRQCEGYTQHKPEVVDYYEPFRDFLHQILKVYAPKRKFNLKKLQILRPYCKMLLTFGLHAVFIEFCKIYGYFCKVIAAYKQARDSTDFFYQIAGILLLLSTTIKFWHLSKVSFLAFLKPKWCYQMEYA